MNDGNNKKEFDDVTPYRASGNLNTAISNLRVNINDMMNVNIQNTSTVQSISKQESSSGTSNSNVSSPPSENAYSTSTESNVTNDNKVNENSTVTRVYVTNDDKPKKKKITLNLGPEFKIALLIIVILLIFVFLMPVITDFP